MYFGKKLLYSALITLLIFLMAGQLFGRTRYETSSRLPGLGKLAVEEPYVTIAVHNIGRIGFTVTNNGYFGTAGTRLVNPDSAQEIAPSCVYPYPQGNDYLFQGSFWIGAVVGRDTLVSVGADGWFQTQEMWPPAYPEGEIEHHSIANPTDIEAISEQDYIAIYTDTLTDSRYVTIDPNDNRPHVPLNIEVTQRSYAWSYSYAEDFVLFDYSIKNIGIKDLTKVYMGFYVDGDVGPIGMDIADARDDICGFRRTIPSPLKNSCDWIDTVNIAWIADNDGLVDAGTGGAGGNAECTSDGGFPNNSPTAITGMKVVRTPSDDLNYSFNWWISNGNAALDFGPRKQGTAEDPFRDWGYLGTPDGDANKYYVMRHKEFDYDQLFTGRDNTANGWLERPTQANDFANGYDTRYLLSFGPFDIYPGEVLPITFAYIAGEDFHPSEGCDNFEDLWNVNFPENYYNTLDFSDFGLNATWASWIYDNPGIDSDNDGDSGKSRICVTDADTNGGAITIIKADTVYYEGDGVPDFRGASPPPPPELYIINDYPIGDTAGVLVTPEVDDLNRGSIKVQWYGYQSELATDVFSGVKDFEGYRVYQGLSANSDDFVLLASYDRVDFNKYIYNSVEREYQIVQDPPVFTLDELQDAYGDNFDPNDYTVSSPYFWFNPDPQIGEDLDSAFYFAPQDWNQAGLSDTFGIHKMYPDEDYPSILDHDSAAIYYPEELDENGYFKYFMYEFVARDLLPSQHYFLAVTAFDFGSPGNNLASLETNPARNFIAEYPQNRNSIVREKGLNVIVYPNPYRADGNYSDDGFEGRGQTDLPDDRIRRIHFTNLPAECTIRIFTIDGDMVRQIDHNCVEDSPGCMHEEWDLITRNTQSVVSGIYYYSVESDSGNQVGKIVIIL